MMKKLFAILLSLTVLFVTASCSTSSESAEASEQIASSSDEQESETTSYQDLYESADAQQVENVAHFSFGLNENLQAVETDSEGWVTFTYTGQPIQIPYYVENLSETIGARFGLLAFVDGYPQPWYLADAEGNPISETDYMQKFDLDVGEEQEFYAVLDPVSGTEGETVGVLLASILEPDYLPESDGYGIYYAMSTTVPYQIRMEADGAHTLTADPSVQYSELSDEVQLAASSEEDPEGFIRDNRTLSLLPSGEASDDSAASAAIEADGTVHLTFTSYWGADVSSLLTVYVDNQPVPVNGADCILVENQTNQLLSAELELDLSGLHLQEDATIYAVLMATGQDYMLDDVHITEPLRLEVDG